MIFVTSRLRAWASIATMLLLTAACGPGGGGTGGVGGAGTGGEGAASTSSTTLVTTTTSSTGSTGSTTSSTSSTTSSTSSTTSSTSSTTSSSSSSNLCPGDMSSPEEVGLYDSTPAESLVVTAVTAYSMTLETTGGETRDFYWAGPDLRSYFDVGDLVSVTLPDFEWFVVEGALYTVATHSAGGFGWPKLSQLTAPPPFTGMTFSTKPQCGISSMLVASLGGESIDVKCYETGKLDVFLVHNGGIVSLSGGGEFSYGESLTLVGRTPP